MIFRKLIFIFVLVSFSFGQTSCNNEEKKKELVPPIYTFNMSDLIGKSVMSSNWGKQNWGEGKMDENVWASYPISSITISNEGGYIITIGDNNNYKIEIPEHYTIAGNSKDNPKTTDYIFLIRGFNSFYFSVMVGSNGIHYASIYRSKYSLTEMANLAWEFKK